MPVTFAMQEITDQQIDQLPNEKIREALQKTIGKIQFCPQCGTVTAFIGQTGNSDSSKCHNCDYTKNF